MKKRVTKAPPTKKRVTKAPPTKKRATKKSAAPKGWLSDDAVLPMRKAVSNPTKIGELDAASTSHMRKVNDAIQGHSARILDLTVQGQMIQAELSATVGALVNLRSDMTALQAGVQERFHISQGTPYRVQMDTGDIILLPPVPEPPAPPPAPPPAVAAVPEPPK